MLRQRGASDERRRRVLSDDAGGDEESSRRTTRRRNAKSSQASTYDDKVLQSQPRITDLVPQRAWILALLWVAGGGLVAGLLAGHYWLAPSAHSSVLDVTASEGLATWAAALALAMTSAVALICFSLRRHKLSDYHGRYRVWLGVSAFTLLASSAVVAPWHLAAGQWLTERTQWKLDAAPLVFWLVPTVLVGAFLLVRLLLDLRGCRTAATGLIFAAIAYATATTFQLGVTPNLDASVLVLIAHGSQLAGHALLLLGLVSAARFILLDAQGLLPERAARKKKATKSDTAESKSKRRIDRSQPATPAPKGRSDLEPNMPATRLADNAKRQAEEEQERLEKRQQRSDQKRKRKAQSRASREDQYDEPMYDDELQGDPHRTSKSERKRLRKLKTQQRRAA